MPLAAFAAPAAAEEGAPPNPFALSLSKGCPSCGAEEGKAGLRQAQPEREGERPRSATPWRRALAAFNRAEARLAAFRRYEAALPAAARAYPACRPLEARSDDLESARLAALRRLLRAPAPDLPALALKITLAIDDEIAFFAGGARCLAAVKADAERLCAAAANASA